MNDPTTPRIHENAVFTRLGEDSGTILNLATKRYYSLNETGIRIWELIEEGRGRAAIAESLAQEFEVDVLMADRRVETFVGELLSEGLLQKA